MIEKKTKEEAIAALKEYVKLPDPPKPGTEKEQLKQLKKAVLIVAGYLSTVPAEEVENEIAGMLQSYADKTEYGIRALIQYDVARSLLDRAADNARKGV